MASGLPVPQKAVHPAGTALEVVVAAAQAFAKVTGGLGRTMFMELLRSEEIRFRFLQVQNPRIPYQCHVQSGRAEVKLVQAGPKFVEQTFFTTRGMDWLADRLGVGEARTAA